MAQTLRIKYAGGLTKMSLAPRIKRSDGFQTRREKKRMTSNAQKYVNSRAQHSQLEFLLAANISQGDWFVTLTYDEAHLPDGWTRANTNMQLLCRKLRESRKPQKTIYFYNIERNHSSDDPQCSHRWHHHMVVSGDVDIEALAKMWGRGHIDAHRIALDPDHTYGALATYLLKESNEFPGKRGWRSSRGLAKPETDTVIVDDDFTLQPPEDPGVMVLENDGPQVTVYGRFQTLKFQALDGYKDHVLFSIPDSRRKARGCNKRCLPDVGPHYTN